MYRYRYLCSRPLDTYVAHERETGLQHATLQFWLLPQAKASLRALYVPAAQASNREHVMGGGGGVQHLFLQSSAVVHVLVEAAGLVFQPIDEQITDVQR